MKARFKTKCSESIRNARLKKEYDCLTPRYTPACAWMTGSEERFETFVKNTKTESKKESFVEVERLVIVTTL